MARWLALVVLAALIAPASATALPDLTITLPSQPNAGQIAPVYVDTFQEPGKVLYRFDAVLHNDGDTLDLFRDEATGQVMQALWPAGEPTEAQDPAAEPPPEVPRQGAGPGSRMEYVVEETHEHWHFFTAARYELEVPGAPTRVSSKIGFCLFDSFDTNGVAAWFPPDRAWCYAPGAHPGFVRMGLSPGAADRYASQREFQYVDITGLAPGSYLLRGVANPDGHVLESDGVADEHTETRLIPGVTADGASATTGPGAPVDVALAARAVGADIPARLAATCRPSARSPSCYRWAAPGDALAFAVAAPPQHGTVAIAGARATYTPAAGFAGADRFTYTATDARGLVSAPASVDVQVTAAAQPPVVARRLLKIGGARRDGRRALAIRISCRAKAVASCSGAVTARVAGRPAGTRRFASLATGRTRTVRVRLSRTLPRRRGAVVTATVRDAGGAGVGARRVFHAGALRR